MSVKKTGLRTVDSLTTCRYSDGFQYSLAALPLHAKRILLLILAQIASIKNHPQHEELTFTISAKEYSKICNLQITGVYRELEKAVKELAKAGIHENVSQDSLRRLKTTNIVSSVIYHIDEGYCTVKINKDVYPYFFELCKAFTTNNLYEYVRLSDKNAMNLYQVIMKRYSKSGTNEEYKTSFIIGIEELKDEMWLFSVENFKKTYLYSIFPRFNQELKKIAQELANSTALKNIKFEIAQKKGRKASHLKISYQHINDLELQETKELNTIEQRLYS